MASVKVEGCSVGSNEAGQLSESPYWVADLSCQYYSLIPQIDASERANEHSQTSE